MKKFWLAILALIASLCFAVGCETRIITQDMIEERVVEYWLYNPAEPGEEQLIKSVPINEGDTFTPIDAPEVEGFEFSGWFTNYPNPHDWAKLTEGSALPETGGLKVHASYEVKFYDLTYIVNGVTMDTQNSCGVTDLLFISDHFKWSKPVEQIAQDLSQAKGYNYKPHFLFFNGFYLDEEFTIPVTQTTKISKATNVYVKYDYAPIHVSYNGSDTASIFRVDTEELDNLNGVLVIPQKDNSDKPITRIEENAFQEAYNLKEIVFPEGFTTIPDGAFEHAYSLEKVVIPSTVTYIGAGAFKNCEALVSAVINTTAEFDVNSVFEGCTNLKGEEYQGAYYLGKNFQGIIAGTTEVEIKPICTEIPANAFANSNVESVIIPASVKKIGQNAFANCTSLVTVIIQSDIDLDIDKIFSGCTNLKGEEYKGAYYIGKYFREIVSINTIAVEIKPTCEEIPANAFANSNVESVIIPASVKKIGENAFANTKITQITLPETVEEVGTGAFKNCALLVTVNITTTAIFEFGEVFENCTAITYEEYGNAYYAGNRFVRPVNQTITWAKIKPDCPYIPKDAFKDCTLLNRVYIPTSVKRIGNHAFYNVNTHYFACHFEGKASSLSYDIGAEESVLQSTYESVNYNFFSMPSGIKIAENGIAYGYRDMMDYTGADAYGIVIFGYFANGTDVTIEAKYPYEGKDYNVELIFQHIFLDNDTVKKITVKSTPVIGASAFLNAKAVEEIILPTSGCTQIGMKSFAGCENLKKVTIGTDVTLIAINAFENCNALEEVKCATDLKAWTTAPSLVESFAANTNIAQAIKTTCANCWFFNAAHSEDVVRATLRNMGF